tara:strand:+ start:1836 stop:2132 length:297 start_codon:yes stop_codon:yes gene_type:complete
MTNTEAIYIAGPMTGLENFNRQAFCDAQSFLESLGFTTLNPAVLPSGLTQGQYMDICFAMIRACSSIFMLDGYKESDGALAELAYAKKLGYEITYEEL